MPTAVKIHKATNSEVRTQSKVFNAATGDDVMPQDIKLYQDYAGKRISMEAQDVAAIKNFYLFGKEGIFLSWNCLFVCLKVESVFDTHGIFL